MSNEPETAALVSEHDCLSFTERGKVHCSVTGHDLPPKAALIRAHLAGSKFKKQKEWYQHDYSKYEPYVTAHIKDARKLYCTLTKHPLNKVPKQIDNHVNSKKFKRLRAEFEEKQKLKEAKRLKQEAKRKAWEERKARGDASGELSDADSDASDFWVGPCATSCIC